MYITELSIGRATHGDFGGILRSNSHNLESHRCHKHISTIITCMTSLCDTEIAA